MTSFSAPWQQPTANVEQQKAGPLARYQQHLSQAGFVDDKSQYQTLEALESLYQALTSSTSNKPPYKAINGLYLWGDVGRGKTFLMGIFYASVAGVPRLRLHFHRFMARIHKALIVQAGHRDPLQRIAKSIAAECRVLCFDEFFVSDIGDAMLLGRLFEALFSEGVTLVATSNIPIDELYKNGLQRQRFLATIEQLNQHTQQLHLSGEVDHRLHDTAYKQRYFVNDSGQQQSDFAACFASMLNSSEPISTALIVHGRVIETIKYNEHIAWFNFDALCDGPRSQLDYIDIASRFKVVILSAVPVLGGEPRSWIRARGTEDGAVAIETGERQLSYAVNDDPARRFISLVDELYDQGVTLYIQADVPMQALYTGGALSFEFRRTLSRLTQMQSKAYSSD